MGREVTHCASGTWEGFIAKAVSVLGQAGRQRLLGGKKWA